MGVLIERSAVVDEIKSHLKDLIERHKVSVEITEFNVQIQEIIEKIPPVELEYSCVGCKHYHDGAGDDDFCAGCCRNYEVDCYEKEE